MSYYYLIASLPMLKLDSDSGITVQYFMGQCADTLSPELLDKLAAVGEIPTSQFCCATEQKWNRFETALRNRVAILVAHKTKADTSKYLRYEEDVFTTLEKEVEDAFDQENPMDVEKAIDSIRWSFLDDLATGHDFDFDALFIYKMRLLIQAKWQGLTVEKGEEQIKTTVDAILSKSGQV